MYLRGREELLVRVQNEQMVRIPIKILFNLNLSFVSLFFFGIVHFNVIAAIGVDFPYDLTAYVLFQKNEILTFNM